MQRRSLLLALLAPALAAAQSAPRRVAVEDTFFDTSVQLAGSELKLNGTGIRGVAWFKGYAAGLYLTARAATPAEALAMPGPKRLQIRMLYEVPANEFTKALHKGVSRNTPAAELSALQARLAKFGAAIDALGKVRKGDVIDLDHEPKRGMAMRVNGTLRGEPIPGDDFFPAVLRAFVGERPYDEKLKAGLLGRTP